MRKFCVPAFSMAAHKSIQRGTHPDTHTHTYTHTHTHTDKVAILGAARTLLAQEITGREMRPSKRLQRAKWRISAPMGERIRRKARALRSNYETRVVMA